MRFLKSIEFKLYSNNIFVYKLYSYFHKKYEKEYYKNKHKALMKMVNLFVKVNNTCFHDIYDSIILWMGYGGDEIILKYIQNKENKKLKILEDLIKDTIKSNVEKNKE